MNRISILLLLVSTTLLGSAQVAKISHPTIDDVSIKSETLKKYITSSDFKYADIIHASLLIGDFASEAESKLMVSSLDKFIEKEIRPTYNPKKAKKSLAKVKQKINAKYFKAYLPGTILQDALATGEFTCISHATINAYILAKLDIPFVVEADGNCFFVTANLDEDIPFGIEGLEMEQIEGNTSFYNDFAEMISGLGVITDEQLLTSTSTEIFEKYYDEPKYMSAKNMLAMHSVLAANLAISTGDFDDGYNLFKLSDILYPTYSTLVMVINSGSLALDDQDFSTDLGTTIISEIYRYNDMYFNHDYLVASAISMHKEMKPKEFNRQFDKLGSMNLPDSTIHRIEWYLNDVKSWDFFNRALLDSAYHYARIAYQKSPRELEQQRLYFNRFIGVYGKKEIETVSIEAQSLFAEFPELQSNPYFYTLKKNLTLVDAAAQIDQNEYAQALKILKVYENMNTVETGDLQPEESNIIRSYGRLAIFYFSTNDENKALELINKALEEYPESRDLLYKKRMIESN